MEVSNCLDFKLRPSLVCASWHFCLKSFYEINLGVKKFILPEYLFSDEKLITEAHRIQKASWIFWILFDHMFANNF